jgi:hypothetical protein
MDFEDIPQEIVEQYGLKAWGNSIEIHNPMYISIQNAKITESLYTYEFQSTAAWITIYKGTLNIHTTTF